MLELEQIKNICDDNVICHECPLFNDDYFKCILYLNPNNLDLEEIKRRLETLPGEWLKQWKEFKENGRRL